MTKKKATTDYGEPWTFAEDAHVVVNKNGTHVIGGSQRPWFQLAERIVRCVNFLAGITDETLTTPNRTNARMMFLEHLRGNPEAVLYADELVVQVENPLNWRRSLMADLLDRCHAHAKMMARSYPGLIAKDLVAALRAWADRLTPEPEQPPRGEVDTKETA